MKLFYYIIIFLGKALLSIFFFLNTASIGINQLHFLNKSFIFFEILKIEKSNFPFSFTHFSSCVFLLAYFPLMHCQRAEDEIHLG